VRKQERNEERYVDGRHGGEEVKQPKANNNCYGPSPLRQCSFIGVSFGTFLRMDASAKPGNFTPKVAMA